MFVDTATVLIRSGHGGSGCLSFRREKYRPRGGPDGGDGGDGGSVIFVGDRSINTLAHFRFSPRLLAQNGRPGKPYNCSGKKGEDLIVKVPLGTVVRNLETGEMLFEITEPGQAVVVARGGSGGRGNQHFATSTNRAPRHVEKGWPGVEVKALLELKVIADVGLLGLPNAGKSSLLAAVSQATPKIADYPFTTRQPYLGVIPRADQRSIVMADIPGIIEGAADGKGLGIQFLRHVERTRLLLVVIDVSSFADTPAAEALRIVRREIKKFGQGLSRKKMLIAANKIDLDPDRHAFRYFLKQLKKADAGLVYPISAVTREGVPALINAIEKGLHGGKV
jgi:GTP-binding protein